MTGVEMLQTQALAWAQASAKEGKGIVIEKTYSQIKSTALVSAMQRYRHRRRFAPSVVQLLDLQLQKCVSPPDGVENHMARQEQLQNTTAYMSICSEQLIGESELSCSDMVEHKAKRCQYSDHQGSSGPRNAVFVVTQTKAELADHLKAIFGEGKHPCNTCSKAILAVAQCG